MISPTVVTTRRRCSLCRHPYGSLETDWRRRYIGNRRSASFGPVTAQQLAEPSDLTVRD